MTSTANPFTASHVIQTGTRRHYVHAEPSDAGGLVLYTEAEWAACDSADWTLDDDGLKFQGSTFAPICHGAALQLFAECKWTSSDGWRDDGTKQSTTEITTLADFARAVPGGVARNDRGQGGAGPAWLGEGSEAVEGCEDEPVELVTESEDPEAWRLAREALIAVAASCTEPTLVAVGPEGDGSNPYQAIYVG